MSSMTRDLLFWRNKSCVPLTFVIIRLITRSFSCGLSASILSNRETTTVSVVCANGQDLSRRNSPRSFSWSESSFISSRRSHGERSVVSSEFPISRSTTSIENSKGLLNSGKSSNMRSLVVSSSLLAMSDISPERCSIVRRLSQEVSRCLGGFYRIYCIFFWNSIHLSYKFLPYAYHHLECKRYPRYFE